MASYYPHKQTIVIIIVCALAVVGTAVYTNWTKPVSDQNVAVNISATSTNENTPIALAGSDDWKKQFFTKETNTVATSATKSTPKTEEDPLTLTDQIGRNFFASYIQLKQSNLTTNDTAVGNAVEYTLGSTLAAATQPKQYTSTNISVSADISPNSLRTYGNAIATAFISYSPQVDAANIATVAFESNDMGRLVQIDPIISAYQKTIAAIISIPVPQSMQKNHLDIINGLSAKLYVAQGLRGAEKDPMQAMIAVGTYDTAHTILENALLGLRNYLEANSISFAPNEPGITLSTITIVP